MTAEVKPVHDVDTMLSYAEAEELTNQIRDGWNQAAASVEYLAPVMREAIQRQAWKVLGRDSVAEWAQEYFGEALLRMDRAMRGEMILELTAAHVSTREIAAAVGESQSTVSCRQRKARESSDSPNHDYTEGRDNKHYPRPKPSEDERAQDAIRRKFDKIVKAMETMMYQIGAQEERSEILDFWEPWGAPAGSEVFPGLPLPAAVDLIIENLDALVDEWEDRHHE
ncbi:MAG TPA: hypothetical protein VIQ76_03800 [Propionibacteriaceae bacterium]